MLPAAAGELPAAARGRGNSQPRPTSRLSISRSEPDPPIDYLLLAAHVLSRQITSSGGVVVAPSEKGSHAYYRMLSFGISPDGACEALSRKPFSRSADRMTATSIVRMRMGPFLHVRPGRQNTGSVPLLYPGLQSTTPVRLRDYSGLAMPPPDYRAPDVDPFEWSSCPSLFTPSPCSGCNNGSYLFMDMSGRQELVRLVSQGLRGTGRH